MPSKLRFFEKKIGSIRFEAEMIPSGPYLLAYEGKEVVGEVAIEAASLFKIAAGGIVGFEDPGEWYVCKYDSRQRHIHLAGFSSTEVRELAGAFGIYVLMDSKEGRHFYDSEAWKGLKEWAVKHPRIASNMAFTDYHEGWYERAIAELRGEENAAIPPP